MMPDTKSRNSGIFLAEIPEFRDLEKTEFPEIRKSEIPELQPLPVLQYSSQVLGLESDSSPVFGDLDLDSDLKAKDSDLDLDLRPRDLDL
jgi:hypothetical protein